MSKSTTIEEELILALAKVSAQTAAVEAETDRLGIGPYDLRDTSGNFVMIPLISARAQILSALTSVKLNQPKYLR